MAKEVVTKLIDDLDGGAAHETVRFGLDGSVMEIDLSSKNAKKLRTELAPYIERGTRVVQPKGAGRSPKATADPKEFNTKVRAWAAEKGHEVAPRGRISSEVLEAYGKAHGYGR